MHRHFKTPIGTYLCGPYELIIELCPVCEIRAIGKHIGTLGTAVGGGVASGDLGPFKIRMANHKGVPYEGSARIAFLLHCPGKVPAGTIVNEALSCVDFLPTTLSLIEVNTVGEEQGRDPSALSRGEKYWNDVAFIRSTSTGKQWLCVVTDDHKLVFSATDEP